MPIQRKLTVKDAMEIYRVSDQTIRSWCKTGKLAAVKIGQNWLIEPDQKQPSR